MSERGIEAFATKVVAEPEFNQAVQAAIAAAEAPAAEAVVAFGAEEGFTFSVEEAAAMGQALRTRFAPADADADAELDDEQLEAVAGGAYASFVSAMPVPPPASMPLPPSTRGIMPIPPPRPVRLFGW